MRASPFSRGSKRLGLIGGAVILTFPGMVGQAQIREEPHQHLGVASCATSVCHGKATEQETGNVWLNEYRIWTAEDRHSRAYQTLSNAESKAIARKLGLASAVTAKICLDCHTDNIDPAKRGPKFQLSDGIGCEACHGGAEQWITSHAEPGATHADNLAKGMYATEKPVARAEICISCHLGTGSQFATHQIMGAGHPRLSFELEAFTTNQPQHYNVDEDYVERKGRIEGFNLWLTGQLVTADRYLSLIKTGLFDPAGAFPELAFYDCHSCHHPMDNQRWPVSLLSQGIKPGSVRLQDHNLQILEGVARVLARPEAAALTGNVRAFVRAGQVSHAAVREAADALLGWIRTKEKAWTTRAFSRAEVQAVRKTIVEMAANGLLADFASAEQAFLSIESLSLALGDAGKLKSSLDKLYATVETDKGYNPGRFAAAAKGALASF